MKCLKFWNFLSMRPWSSGFGVGRGWVELNAQGWEFWDLNGFGIQGSLYEDNPPHRGQEEP